MLQTVSKYGTLTGGSAAQNLDLGFVPDEFAMWAAGDTAADIVEARWQSTMADASAIVSKVVADSGSTGNKSQAYIAANGFTPWYKSGGATTDLPAIRRWAASTVYAVGDLVRPTVLPAGVTSSRVYRCTTAGTSHSAEPTWLAVVGGTTSEGGGTCVWTLLDGGDSYNKQKMLEGQGLTIGTGVQTNALVYHYAAKGRVTV